jgi:hypothetical protein
MLGDCSTWGHREAKQASRGVLDERGLQSSGLADHVFEVGLSAGFLLLDGDVLELGVEELLVAVLDVEVLAAG